MVDDKPDGHTEHGEDMGVVDGSYDHLASAAAFTKQKRDIKHTVQRINTPGRLLVDEIVASLALGICFFSQELMRRISRLNGVLDQRLDLYTVSIQTTIISNRRAYRPTLVRLGHNIHGTVLLLDLLYRSRDAFLDIVQ